MGHMAEGHMGQKLLVHSPGRLLQQDGSNGSWVISMTNCLLDGIMGHGSRGSFVS